MYPYNFEMRTLMLNMKWKPEKRKKLINLTFKLKTLVRNLIPYSEKDPAGKGQIF